MTLQLNSPVPDFELPDLNGKTHHLSDHRGRIVIVNFWSCECPHSERTDKAILSMFVQWQDDVSMLTIASNRSESAEALRPLRMSSFWMERESCVIVVRWMT
jgi:thiol-disulfide isomerase/thioredoxin